MKKLTFLVCCLFLIGATQTAIAQCNISGPSTVDTGDNTNYSTATVSGASFFWSTTGVFNIIGGNTSSSVTVRANNPGTGSVCVTRFKAGEEPCCSCKDVTAVEEPPCIPATSISLRQIEISGNGCPGDIVEFRATVQPSNAMGTIRWQAGTNFINSPPFFQQIGGTTAFINTPAGQGSVWVRVTFTSCDGSTVTAFTLVVWERGCPRSSFPTSGIDSKSSISPNPFKDYTQLSFDSEGEVDAQVEIFNVSGQLIYSKATHFFNGKNQITVNDLPNEEKGVLFYQVKTEKGILAFGKMFRTN